MSDEPLHHSHRVLHRKEKTLRIETREMGVVEIAPERVLDFVAPILGFESYR